MKTFIAVLLVVTAVGCTNAVDPIAPDTQVGTFTFSIYTDSGFRLYIDGNLVGNYMTTRDVRVPLGPGLHHALVSTAEYARTPIALRVTDDAGNLRVIEDSRGREDLYATLFVE